MATTATKDVRGGSPEQRKFTARIYRGEQWYVAECLELGTVSQGKTVQAALDNLLEATELYLEEFPEAANETIEQTIDLVEGVRELEQAYSELIGEPIEPSSIYPVGTTTFTIPGVYA
jgi:predicted RNase H-like HicB family nuclease